MSLFQKSVEKNYLKLQDQTNVEKAFKKFTKYFQNKEIQQNIREAKEEQFQEGFLSELFVNVFGYTLNPKPKFDLTTEFKNEKGAKKADGAILKDGKAIAVIELKGTNTKDLERIRQQAFDYKANQSECTYVITSNFEKLRFYINDAVEFEEFDLFKLNEERFALLYLCLNKESIFNNTPLKIKQDSVVEEENITKKFYAHYSLFKRELYRDLVKENMKNEVFRTELQKEDTERANKNIKLTLFKKSQKLIDRFLFIFFAEDRGLLPPNSTRKILEDWNKLKDLDAAVPLYDRFKLYFKYLDTGRKGTDKKVEIFAYNGGLFKPDPILDSLIIDDQLLFKHTKDLSDYNFESQVGVNILGHIFENSLNEIENVNAEIEGVEFDKQKTKRKKDGVFYTPKYITKYIVDNTVGKLCEEKKAALEINEEDYLKSRKGRPKKVLEALQQKLEEYREWLLSLSILDPACGSGAFLNQALDFLIKEHKYIDELHANLLNVPIVFQDIENTVLEKNIYGVDLNEESVEIAKLSLWLRTAQPRRKLNVLNNNIKCGNSLIDDPKVAGTKAFNWYKEFPEIFKPKDKKAWHITMVLHNSRYSEISGTAGQLQEGFIAPTYPELSEEQQEILAEELAKAALEYELNILECNICNDHVHAIIVCEEEELSTLVGKWKGRSAFEYNRRVNQAMDEKSPMYADGTKEKFWAKSFHKKPIHDQSQLENTIKYIQKNREKHQLPAPTSGLTRKLETITCSQQHAFRPEFKGGFDVVIGNPPYVFAREKISQIEKDYYSQKYKSADYQVNTYLLFIEKTINILKENAHYGLIVPNAWLMIYSGKGLRNYIIETSKLNQIINLEGYSFEGVNVETIIILAKKKHVSNNEFKILLSNEKEFVFSHIRNQVDFSNNEGFEFRVFSDDVSIALSKKMRRNSVILNSIVQIKAGLQAYEKGKGTPKQSAEDVKNRPYDYTYKFDKNTCKYLDGKDVSRYYEHWSGLYLKYGEHLAAPRSFNLFSDKKIIVREITGKYPNCIISTYNEDVYLYNRSNIAIVEKDGKLISLKYIVGVLNSKLISYYFIKNTAKSVRKMFPKIILKDLRLFPFKELNNNAQKPFIESVDMMLSLNFELQQIKIKFIEFLKTKFDFEKLTTKLQNWYELAFKEFIGELKKSKIKLSLAEEAEWMKYFNEQKEKAQKLKTEIAKTDKEIDQMVYELYGLTEKEIKIVEEGVK